MSESFNLDSEVDLSAFGQDNESNIAGNFSCFDGSFNLDTSASPSLFTPEQGFNSSTPQAKRLKTSRVTSLKCTDCGKCLASDENLKTHQQNHVLEEAASRLPSTEAFRIQFLRDGRETVKEMEMSLPVSNSSRGLLYKAYISGVSSKFQGAECPDVEEFLKTIGYVVEPVLDRTLGAGGRKKKSVLPPSIRREVRLAMTDSLTDNETLALWKEKLQKIAGPISENYPEVFLKCFTRRVTTKVAAFLLQSMKTFAEDVHIERSKPFIRERSQLSGDDWDSLFDRQSLHNVLGWVVKAILNRSAQYSDSKLWQNFQKVLLERFAVRGTAVPDYKDETFWTALKARENYTFVSAEVTAFFVEVAKTICYSETIDGNLPPKVILDAVLKSPSLLSQWDELIQGSLSEKDSLNLLQKMVITLSFKFGVGILKRRMNEEAKRSKANKVSSVGIRAKLVTRS